MLTALAAFVAVLAIVQPVMAQPPPGGGGGGPGGGGGGGPGGGGGGGPGGIVGGGCDDCEELLCGDSEYANSIFCMDFILNLDGTMSKVFDTVQVNVQNVTIARSPSTGADYFKVESTSKSTCTSMAPKHDQ